ncbi:MAG: cupin domain-containing protein [Acidiferrobacterales bacterium]
MNAPETLYKLPSTDAAEWTTLRPGVQIKHLFKHPESGYEVALVRYQAGASVPSHVHVADEHVYVLSGSQEDERGEYPAGSYIFNGTGSKHSVRSVGGCLALLHWLAPVRFL